MKWKLQFLCSFSIYMLMVWNYVSLICCMGDGKYDAFMFLPVLNNLFII